MTRVKLFAQIFSLREITKNSYIVKIEVVSLSDNGIVPNIDFIIKAGNVSKTRTTDSKGVFKNDEFFESTEEIKEIHLFDINKNLVSTYFLPSYASIETKEIISKYNIEINELKNIINNLKNKISAFKDEKDNILTKNNKTVKELKNKILQLNKNTLNLEEKIKDFEDTYVEKKKIRLLKKDYDAIQVGDKVWLNDNLKIFLINCKIDNSDNYFYDITSLSHIEKKLKGTGWRIPTHKDLEGFIEFFLYNTKEVLNLHNKCFIKFTEEINESDYHFFWAVGENVYWFNKEKVTFGKSSFEYATHNLDDFRGHLDYINIRLVKDL